MYNHRLAPAPKSLGQPDIRRGVPVAAGRVELMNQMICGPGHAFTAASQ